MQQIAGYVIATDRNKRIKAGMKLTLIDEAYLSHFDCRHSKSPHIYLGKIGMIISMIFN